MAANDLVTEAQLDSLTTTIATSVKGNTTATNAHTGAATAAHAASAISVLDTAAVLTATDVEAALYEIYVIADAAAGGGVSINDAATNTTQAWSSSKIDTEIAAGVAGLVDGAPTLIDTLNELAAAIGDDPNFAATMTTALGNRLRFDAAQSLSGGEQTQALTNLGVARSVTDFAAAFTTAIG